LRRDDRGAVRAVVPHHFGNEKGWKLAFIITGAVGFIWLIFWFWLYDTPAKANGCRKRNTIYIHSDKDEAARSQIRQESGRKYFFLRRPRAALRVLGHDDHDPHLVRLHLFHHRKNCRCECA
jgi:hypothetical protein